MKGIIIAAGRGLRLRPITNVLPKCMLEVAGRPILHHTMDCMRQAGCSEIVVIVGHEASRVHADGAFLVTNEDYANNNILHSLMYARDHLTGPVMCSYSDIWVEPEIHSALTATEGDIVVAADRDWTPYYDRRTDHALPEAENIFVDRENVVAKIGKYLRPDDAGSFLCGEFLGLWRMSAEGTELFGRTFDELDARLGRDEPFQHAALWKTAYITDMVQELIDRGNRIDCAVIERGWAELDTVQDFERLEAIAERQRLWTICGRPSVS